MRITSRSVLRRVLPAAAAVCVAALVATGCGGSSGGGGEGETGVVGDDGPLAWLPADTWVVATANLDPDTIDTAVQSLDRLPIWSLAEGFLPASDGKGLRRELLEQVAKSASNGKDTGKVTAKELEAAFGNHTGFAITDTDFEAIDGDEPPFVAWIEVDDEDQALGVAKDLFAGKDTEREHEGVTYFQSKDDDATFLVRDGLLVVSTAPKQMERLIDVRDGDDSLAGDDVAAAVLEAGVGDALVGFAVASEPLLEAAPDLVRGTATKVDEDGEADEDAKAAADKAAKIADELGPVLESNAVDGLIADWISGSATIDERGLRIRGAWSNPRELADPEPGSRELVERMPASVPVVTGAVSDGTTLARVQDAWGEMRDAYDLDLRQLVAGECSQADRWACDLGIELALTVLEDEDLASALEEQGDTAMVFTQDLGPLLGSLANLSDPAAAKPAAVKPLQSRLYEVVSTAGAVEYAPPAELLAAMQAAGLSVTPSKDGLSFTVKVLPGSPLASELRSNVTPSDVAALRAFGIDLAALQGTGLTLTAEEVDDLLVAGFPQDAPSKVVPALRGDTDTLGESSTYEDVVAAAKPPKEVGMYGYVDLKYYVESLLTTLGASSPEVQRIVPTVRNNLADVPGIVTWSAREDVDGEPVGTFEMSMPILE